METIQQDRPTKKRTFIKFCRIRRTSVVDQMAVLGVDFAGIHLINDVNSEALGDASALCSRARQVGVQPVLVTKVTDSDLVARAIESTEVRWVQLHRFWNLEAIAALRSRLDRLRAPISVIALISPQVAVDAKYASSILRLCEYVIVDQERGGTGQPVGRPFLAWIFDHVPKEKVIVAGGLTVESVIGLIRAYRPAAVDVQSGIIGNKGDQSLALMTEFVSAVRTADYHM